MPHVILLAVDGSPLARSAARHVVDRLALPSPDYDLHLINVQYRVPPRAAAAVGRDIVTDYYRSEAEIAIRDAQRILDAAGIAYRVVRRLGHPPAEIARYAESAKADLIVMGSHGRGAASGLLLGSVAQGVLAGCRVPVLIVRDGGGAGTADEVLVAVDGSAFTRRAIMYLLRRRALLAPSAKITLIHVAAPALPLPFAIGKAQNRAAIEAQHERAMRAARRLLAKAHLQWREVCAEGDPATKIADYVRTSEPGLVVMGSHGRNAMAGLVLGSVTQKTLSACRTPVLIVRR